MTRVDQYGDLPVRLTHGNWVGLISLALSIIGAIGAQWVQNASRMATIETRIEAQKESIGELKSSLAELNRRLYSR